MAADTRIDALSDGEPSDAEYHSHDFDIREVEAEGHARVCVYTHFPDRTADAAAAAAGAARAWNNFFVRHAGKFFKPRNYLLREFPVLRALPAPARVLEIGAGNGSNVFTLLHKCLGVRVDVCDLCPAALRAIVRHELAGRHADRLRCFLWDAVAGRTPERVSKAPRTEAAACPSTAGISDGCGPDEARPSVAAADSHAVDPLAHGGVDESWFLLPSDMCAGMDAAVCMFMLSAVHPKDHKTAIRNIAATLKPGASLCFRDYGMYDMAMLRAEEKNVLTPQLHMRGDGTLAYYFRDDEVRELLESAGLIVEELEYCTIRNVNRRKGVEMKRVWVHARAVKPEALPA